MGFARAISVPRPIVLGGRTYLARELRVQDFAALEALAAALAGDPLAKLDPADHAALRAAHTAAEDWPPSWGSEACQRAVFGTAAGRALLLTLVLRDSGPGPDDGAGLAGLTAVEWDALERVAFGVDPRRTLDRLVYEAAGITVPASRGPRGVPWEQAIAETCAMLHKTPAEVGAMTLSEVALVRSGGKPPEREITPPAGWSDERVEAELAGPLERFWAEAEAAAEAGVKGGGP
jgi:hypothetical protein